MANEGRLGILGAGEHFRYVMNKINQIKQVIVSPFISNEESKKEMEKIYRASEKKDEISKIMEEFNFGQTVKNFSDEHGIELLSNIRKEEFREWKDDVEEVRAYMETTERFDFYMYGNNKIRQYGLILTVDKGEEPDEGPEGNASERLGERQRLEKLFGAQTKMNKIRSFFGLKPKANLENIDLILAELDTTLNAVNKLETYEYLSGIDKGERMQVLKRAQNEAKTENELITSVPGTYNQSLRLKELLRNERELFQQLKEVRKRVEVILSFDFPKVPPGQGNNSKKPSKYKKN